MVYTVIQTYGKGPFRQREEVRKEMFYLMSNSTHLQLYGIIHMVKDHSDSEIGNPQPPLHGVLIPISSKRSFICTIQQTE